MFQKLLHMSKDTVIAGTAIVTVGTLLNSIFAYVLQIGLGRTLSVSDYGTFNALLSLSVVFAVPGMALTNSIIKTVSKLKAEERFDTLTQLFIRSVLLAFTFGVFVFMLVVVFRSILADYLNISDLNLFIPFGFFLGATFLNINSNAYLQGLLRFKAFAFFLSTGGFLRALISLTLVLVGLGVGGAYLGMTISAALVFLISLLLLKKNFRRYNRESLNHHYRYILSFGVATLFVGIGMNMLNNMDIILVKHYFNGDTTGIYSAIVTVGKVFLFGAGTVTVLMYPQISGLYAKNENFLRRFKKFLYLQLALIVGGVFTFLLFSKLIVLVMFGKNFLTAVPYLPKFSIFVAFYILVNFLNMFLLAISKKLVWIFLIPGVIGQYVLITFFHNSLDDIINVNIVVSGIVLFLVSAYCLKSLKDARIDHSTSL